MSKYTPDFAPSYISDDLRIVDLDALQYAIQRRSFSQKDAEYKWESIRFCTTAKSLAKTAMEVVRDRAAARASAEAREQFVNSGIEKIILAMPDKRGKARK